MPNTRQVTDIPRIERLLAAQNSFMDQHGQIFVDNQLVASRKVALRILQAVTDRCGVGAVKQGIPRGSQTRFRLKSLSCFCI